MEYLLILLSFLLHMVTFIVLRHYYLKQQSYQSEQHTFQEEKKELEQLLMSYLIEMKEENDRLLDAFNTMQKQDIEKNASSTSVTHHLDEDEQISKDQAEKSVSKEQSYTPLVDAIEDQPVAYQKSYQAEIIERYEKGETPEQIAKALNRGKTEVALIIKFHKN
ncbi:swarming motility protein SwrB [Halolactibacillus miurensis]|uniref:Swarming motility protein SwrB n=2 Tax=Bacillaceae TaxID=186817 RepID=A0A1I6QFI8_9BACI|nr:hypothetical protein [Halolactibacillus miurensis]GEM03408.1 swarming motility protein SwrB [Halolactibacillus miurensis]SFS51060.1 hypothetical protein SAMN05421668_104113 [Halolactibacillus miurensis]